MSAFPESGHKVGVAAYFRFRLIAVFSISGFKAKNPTLTPNTGHWLNPAIVAIEAVCQGILFGLINYFPHWIIQTAFQHNSDHLATDLR
jgi:hypothetical protein